MPRAYDNTRRAQAAAETSERIGRATEELLTRQPTAAVTLQAIAEAAGVTVQTVLRHMGSREGCFLAAAQRVSARVDAHRAHAAPGDVDAALAGLLTHYEADGRLILNLLASEPTDDFASAAVEQGRAYHRAWVARCFGPHLPDEPGAHAAAVDALVAATDLYVWKLLRLDLGRAPEDVAAVVSRLVRGVLGAR